MAWTDSKVAKAKKELIVEIGSLYALSTPALLEKARKINPIDNENRSRDKLLRFLALNAICKALPTP